MPVSLTRRGSRSTYDGDLHPQECAHAWAHHKKKPDLAVGFRGCQVLANSVLSGLAAARSAETQQPKSQEHEARGFRYHLDSELALAIDFK